MSKNLQNMMKERDCMTLVLIKPTLKYLWVSKKIQGLPPQFETYVSKTPSRTYALNTGWTRTSRVPSTTKTISRHMFTTT
jgi:hypothetical protein